MSDPASDIFKPVEKKVKRAVSSDIGKAVIAGSLGGVGGLAGSIAGSTGVGLLAKGSKTSTPQFGDIKAPSLASEGEMAAEAQRKKLSKRRGRAANILAGRHKSGAKSGAGILSKAASGKDKATTPNKSLSQRREVFGNKIKGFNGVMGKLGKKLSEG